MRLVEGARWTVATVLVLGIALTALPPVPSEAYPRANYSICGPVVTWDFAGTGWNHDRRTAVIQGFNRWATARDYNAQTVATIIRDLTAPEFEVRWDTGNTRANCPQRVIYLNTGLQHDLDRLVTSAAHELGHILRARHTGRAASLGGDNPPTMSTCLTASQLRTRQFSRDDEASYTHKIGRLAQQGQPTIHANTGFENASGFQHWGRDGGTAVGVIHSPGHAASGHKYLQFRGSAESDRIWQTVNYLTARSRIDGRVNARRLDSSHSGAVTIELLVRRLTYSTSHTSCTAGNFIPDVNLNNLVSTGGFSLVAQRSISVPTAWAIVQTTSEYQIPDWHGADVRVQFRSAVRTSSGTLATVGVDDLRGRDRS